jgi:pimeloyl-ACP methyl ester carboxylesterase
MKKVAWAGIIVLATLTSLIPLTYINADPETGFLGLKEDTVLQDMAWKVNFNIHIVSGGIAMLIGWMQFSQKLLRKHPNWHRSIGKIYFIAGLSCGLSGIVVGFYAHGGPIAQMGFVLAGCTYFYTTLMGYLRIRRKDVEGHMAMMAYSYSVCLAAVSLRLYSPLLAIALGDYTTAYRIVAWLSWIPNLFMANQVIKRWDMLGLGSALRHNITPKSNIAGPQNWLVRFWALELIVVLCALGGTLQAQQPVEANLLPGADMRIGNRSFKTMSGTIVVPENYAAQGSQNLKLPVLVIKSPNPEPAEPVFWLDGGPGGSNILSEQKVDLPSAANALQNHDLVCVGYRGVDGSVKLIAPQITKAFRGANHKLIGEKSLKKIKKSIERYTRELQASGTDINNYNILNVIEDIENVRKHLGYKQINLLAVSYGTRVAMLYAYKYPETIKRSVMIGACPPGYFLARPDNTDAVLSAYEKMALLTDTIALVETMKKAFNQMPRRWFVFRLDADKIKAGTVNGLYSVDLAVATLDAYKRAAQNGDYSGLFLLQKISDLSRPTTIGDVYAKTVSADMDMGIDYQQELNKPNSVLGGNMALLYANTADAWGIRPIPEMYRQYRTIAMETLVISGDLDHRTPASVTQTQLMPFLPNGKHLLLKNASHIDILRRVMMAPNFLQQFYDEGKLDERLLEDPEPINFVPKIKISKFKIALLGVLK